MGKHKGEKSKGKGKGKGKGESNVRGKGRLRVKGQVPCKRSVCSVEFTQSALTKRAVPCSPI